MSETVVPLDKRALTQVAINVLSRHVGRRLRFSHVEGAATIVWFDGTKQHRFDASRFLSRYALKRNFDHHVRMTLHA